MIDKKKLQRAISQEMIDFVREHQDEIVRRAQERLKKTIKEEKKKDEP